MDCKTLNEYIANKVLRTHSCDPVGEGDQEAGFDPGAGDEREALLEGCQETRSVCRTQKLDRVGIKSHRQSTRTKHMGALDYVRQDGLVTPMNSIEIPDTEDGTTRWIVIAKGIAKNFHSRDSALHR